MTFVCLIFFKSSLRFHYKKKKLSTPGLTLFLLIKTQTSYLGDLFQKSHSVFYQIKFGKLLDKKKIFKKLTPKRLKNYD